MIGSPLQQSQAVGVYVAINLKLPHPYGSE